MKRLSVAILAAQNAAVNRVSLESHLDELSDTNASMETHLNEIDDLAQLASGLESVVSSLESIDSPTFAQHQMARRQALSFLEISGLSVGESRQIFPSLEADKPASGWEKFKVFLAKLWEMVKAAAKKVYTFIDNVLKSSTVAEKAAMVRLRDLRKRLNARRSSLTVKAKLPLREAHGYLCTADSNADKPFAIVPTDYPQVARAVAVWKRGRDVIQAKLPRALESVSTALQEAIDALALSGTDAEVTASIDKNRTKIYAALDPLFGGNLRKTLGIGTAGQDKFPLIYDRVLLFNGADDDIEISELDAGAEGNRAEMLARYGVTVEQIDLGDTFAREHLFTAMPANNITQLLSTVEELINDGHSADQARAWGRLRRRLDIYGGAIDTVLRNVLKREGLGQAERSLITFALHASRALSRWAAAPYAQLNTLNLRVVGSLLTLAEDQIKNLDESDSESKVKKDKDEAGKKSNKDKDESQEHVESIRNRG